MLGAESFAEDAPRLSVAESIGREVQALFERCRKAVVRIEASDRHGRLSGSGFFIDPNGTIYTSYSVGGESHAIVVHHGALTYPARCVMADARSGVAILKVAAQTPFLLLGRGHTLAVASPVLAIGYPLDLPVTPSFGTIGGFDIGYRDSYFATRHIRAKLPVQRGESGAPLLNMRGEAVGILIASIDGGRASYALPVEAAEKVRKDFMRFGDVRPGWMGIEIEPAAAPIAGSTAQVNRLFPDSPGAKGGLEKGDVIVQLGGHPVRSPDDVRNAAFFITAHDELSIKVVRGSAELELTMHPDDLPGSTHASRNGKSTGPAPALDPAEFRAALPLDLGK